MALDDLIVTAAAVVIAAFIFARVLRIALHAYRNGRPTAAMIFAAFLCALLAAMLAVLSEIHAGRVGRTDAFEWLASLCMAYGCFKLWLRLRGDGPVWGSLYDDFPRHHAKQATIAGGAVVGRSVLDRAAAGEVTEDAGANYLLDPSYYYMPQNIHHSNLLDK